MAFHILAGILLASAFLVVSARNPVHSALWLILSFVAAAGLMLLIGAELTAMLIVVVYVGAVIVLFLFVLMMLDIGSGARRGNHLLPGALIAILLLVEFGAINALVFESDWPGLDPSPGAATNAQSIGSVLFTDYFLAFQLAGLVLLVAQIGAILLTLRHRKRVRRQNIPEQIGRQRKDSFEMKDLPPGRGI